MDTPVATAATAPADTAIPPTQTTETAAEAPAAPQPPRPQPAASPAVPPAGGRNAEEERTAAAARASGIPYFDTRTLDKVESAGAGLELEVLRKYKVAPLHHYNERSVELGLTSQTDRSKLPELQGLLPNVQLTFKTISRTGYSLILNRLYYDMFAEERAGNFKVFGRKLATTAPKQAFQYIAQLAYWLDASDIHIEPQHEVARIRFRIDGVLHPITAVDLKSYQVFLSDLQTQANIKWGSNRPQTGRISYNLMSHQARVVTVNMRIETIPTFRGEEIVVRLFNDQARDLQLSELGFAPEQANKLMEVVSHPNGMVLTVGPTGSGKTSTLYALINHLNRPEIKIITLEDPVEYELSGITQIPVRSDDKELFAEKLRAVMREDPNVIMIGEIRDIDTAKTALQAALTGHLMLSTFHATDAAAAISRMLDMIGTNPLFASAVRMIIAQRLARRICTHCSEEVAPTQVQLQFIEQSLKEIPEARRPKLASSFKLRRGQGCAACHGLGYQGRIAIVEMMAITPEIEKLMTSVNKTTAQDLEAAAVRGGMVTLLEDGLRKALDGTTTIDEIIDLTIA